MKTIFTAFFLLNFLFLTAASLDTMCVHTSNLGMVKFAVEDIDSITFARAEMTSDYAKSENLPGDSSDHFWEVEAISKDVAYIANNQLKLYKTTDGAQSWTDVTPQFTPPAGSVGPVPQVSFLTEDIGCVAFSVDDGGNGYDYNKVYAYVWCTRDGGQTWSQSFAGNQDQILHLQQVDETTVYYSGTAKYGVSSNRWFKKITYNSSNQTYTLSSITGPPTDFPHVMSVDWLDTQTAVAVFKNNTHYKQEPFMTTNGGSSWVSINGNLPSISAASYSYCSRAINILDANTFVYVVTYNSSQTTQIWYTENTGATWTQAQFDEPQGKLLALDFSTDGDVGIVSSADSVNCVYTSSDGGKNWERVVIEGLREYPTITCPDIAADGSQWIVGYYRELWIKD